MSRKKPPAVKEDVTCNLIPMIDIMFLLLLFFMLSADMTQREFEDVVLPVADKVEESEKEKGGEVQTTINIFHRPDSASFTCPLFAHGSVCRDQSHWLVGAGGQEFTRDTIRDRLKIVAEESLEPEVDPVTNKRMSARKIVIRADHLAPYGDVQRILQLCGEFGIYKIEVAAAAPITG